MKNFERFINSYQISETLRFELTLRKKIRKNGFEEEIYMSYSNLQELIKISEQEIIRDMTEENKLFE
ncbi:MAG: hypothetical protein LBE12_03610 [Planctomycetaceae bacterium]|jgi:hypothetical protein|nr:hypothetical protein [Planctomycetaceae bacterium]